MPQCIPLPNMVPSCGFLSNRSSYTLQILGHCWLCNFVGAVWSPGHKARTSIFRTVRIGTVLAFCGGVLFPITSQDQCNHVFLGWQVSLLPCAKLLAFGESAWWASWMMKKVCAAAVGSWFSHAWIVDAKTPKIRRFWLFLIYIQIAPYKPVRVKCFSANKLPQGFQSSPQRLKICSLPWPGLAKRSPCWEKKASYTKFGSWR